MDFDLTVGVLQRKHTTYTHAHIHRQILQYYVAYFKIKKSNTKVTQFTESK